MTGNIFDIDYIGGSNDDREGGIVIVFKDGTEYETNCIEFDLSNLTFQTS